MAKWKVKLRSHHDVAHIHPTANVPTKYDLFPRLPDQLQYPTAHLDAKSEKKISTQSSKFVRVTARNRSKRS